jgi:hypothetical protein
MSYCKFLFALWPCIALGSTPLLGDEPKATNALSAAELQSARTLAEQSLGINPGSPERIYLIKIELLPQSQAESVHRQVLVTHYRYHDDQTILTMVDLNRHSVVKVEKFAHFPTALASAEINKALDLARHDERLRPLLETSQPRIEVQAMPVQMTQPTDALFGHRLVQLQLSKGDRYLRTPRVLVDLSADVVHLNSAE